MQIFGLLKLLYRTRKLAALFVLFETVFKGYRKVNKVKTKRELKREAKAKNKDKE